MLLLLLLLLLYLSSWNTKVVEISWLRWWSNRSNCSRSVRPLFIWLYFLSLHTWWSVSCDIISWIRISIEIENHWRYPLSYELFILLNNILSGWCRCCSSITTSIAKTLFLRVKIPCLIHLPQRRIVTSRYSWGDPSSFRAIWYSCWIKSLIRSSCLWDRIFMTTS